MPTYVYGLTNRGAAAPRRLGIEDADTRVVEGDRLGALVATIATSSVDAVRGNLMTHSDVLQEAIERGSVVPMRFGTVFESDDAVLKDLLEARQTELADVLDRVRDKVELTLKAYYVQEAVLAEVVADDPAIVRLQRSTRELPGDAGYYERIRLGELVAAAVERLRARDAAVLLATLRPLAVAEQESAELPEWMVTKASFLVERDAVEDVSARVDDLAHQQAGRMKLALVGPLPPYSFVDLGAKAETAA